MRRHVWRLDGEFAADWAVYGLGDHSVTHNVSEHQASHRATTSSRTPGKINRGTVYATAFAHSELHLCKCGQRQHQCRTCAEWICTAPGHAPHLCEETA